MPSVVRKAQERVHRRKAQERVLPSCMKAEREGNLDAGWEDMISRLSDMARDDFETLRDGPR